MRPLPANQNGVCKPQAASQEPKKQRGLRAAKRSETASVFLGGSRLTRAEGLAPKQLTVAAGKHASAGRREIMREGASPARAETLVCRSFTCCGWFQSDP